MSSRKGFENPSSDGSSGPPFKGKSTSGTSNMNSDSADDEEEKYGKKYENRNRSNAPQQWVARGSSSKDCDRSDTVQKLEKQGVCSNQTGHSIKNAGGGHYKPQSSNQMREGHASTQWSPWDSSSKDWGQLDTVQRNRRGYGYDSTKNAGSGHHKLQSSNRLPDSDFYRTRPVKQTLQWCVKAASSWSSEDGSVHKENAQEVNAGTRRQSESDGIDDEFPSDDFYSNESQTSHETREKNRSFKKGTQCLDGVTVEKKNDPERKWHGPACKGRSGATASYSGLHKQIVWPPMVVIMNTRLRRDENEKWIGIEIQELLEDFIAYSAINAQNSYGPEGHRGMSILIFEASAAGYIEAESLCKHFEENFGDRMAWEKLKDSSSSEGKPQLYGFMAEKKDMEDFNKHSQGKHKLKYEMISYELILKKMRADSAANEKELRKVIDKLHSTLDAYRNLELSNKKHQDQMKQQMDAQETFYKEKMDTFYEATAAKEENSEKIRHELVPSEKCLHRMEQFVNSIQSKDKRMEFIKEGEKLIKAHEKQKLELELQHLDEKMALEQRMDEKLSMLMDKYVEI